MEEQLQNEIASVTQQFLQHLQNERDTLVSCCSTANGAHLKFQKSKEFDQIFQSLMRTSFGSLSTDFMLPSPPMSASNSQTLFDTNISWQKTIDQAKKRYDHMEVVAVVEGRDLLGSEFTRPSSLCAVPQASCVAVVYNHSKLSLISSSAALMASFEVSPRTDSRIPLRSGTNCLAADPMNGLLYCIERNNIASVKPSSATSFAGQCSTRTCVKPTREMSYGLAVDSVNRQLFTCSGHCVIGYSMRDWTLRTRIKLTDELDHFAAAALGCHSDQLFYAGHAGKSLKTVPIDSGGNLVPDKFQVIADDFREIRGFAIDAEGFFLVADKARGLIDILKPDDGKRLTSLKLCSSSFQPCGICVLTAASTPFMLESGSYTHLVVAADQAANRIIFFGSN